MKQPKWIVRIEAIDRKGTGFWVDRNWSETALVQTTSVIDAVAAGAHAPETGASPSEGSPTRATGASAWSRCGWTTALGRKPSCALPALSPLTWVQWRYDWKATPGKHVFRVRAYDGTGELQVTEDNPALPQRGHGHPREERERPRLVFI